MFSTLYNAVASALKEIRPATVAGPMATGGESRFGVRTPTVAGRGAQAVRVGQYEQWRQGGSQRNLWTTWAGYYQMASGQWIPVHSSNVSAVRWQALRRGAVQELAPRSIQGGPSHPWYQDMLHVGQGHSARTVTIKGRTLDVRDVTGIRKLLTPRERRYFDKRVLNPVPVRESTAKIDNSFIRRLAPTVSGERITNSSVGNLFVRFHDGRVYLYPYQTLGKALDALQAPSKGRWCWQELRWAGVPYQQIAGPPVKFRVGAGH